MDVALDDIIKSNRQKTGKPFNKAGGKFKQRTGGFGGRKVSVVKGVQSGRVGRVSDVRQRINMRMNAKMRNVDAREKIAASQRRNVTDARQLLASKSSGPQPDFLLPTKIIKNNMYKKPSPKVTVAYDAPARNGSSMGARVARKQQPDLRRQQAPLSRTQAPLRRTQPVSVPFEVPMEVPRHSRQRSRSPLLSKRAAAPPPPMQTIIQGFKVSISNLHPGVTREDIYELFSSVGPIKKCILVRPGEAEVVYPKKEDSLAAVRRYDRRELDGMPMRLKVSTVGIKTNQAPDRSRGDLQVDPYAVQAALFHRSAGSAASNSRRPVNFKVSI